MTDIRYTKDHEYVRIDGQTGFVGITDHAQSQLGDIVYVELPPPGKSLKAGDEVAVIESVKAAAELYAPVTGEVVEINSALEADPALVNREAESGGWFLKLKLADSSQVDGLMDAEAYAKYVEGLA